ncbi:hypothetical protein [Comamonas sp. CMM02]|nr:hypothetical protein [Comamonas sp. CMM02]MBD9400819.1 hypothetical protein [Comamonas sp. CMM02]
MNCYRITHIDEHRTRRRLRVLAANCRQALQAGAFHRNVLSRVQPVD